MQKCVDCGTDGARAYFGDDVKPDGPLCTPCWHKRREASEVRLGKCVLCGEIPAKALFGNNCKLGAKEYLIAGEKKTTGLSVPSFRDISVRLPANSDIARYLRRKAYKDNTSVAALVRSIIWEHMEGSDE